MIFHDSKAKYPEVWKAGWDAYEQDSENDPFNPFDKLDERSTVFMDGYCAALMADDYIY